jgi:hypothetical protein
MIYSPLSATEKRKYTICRAPGRRETKEFFRRSSRTSAESDGVSCVFFYFSQRVLQCRMTGSKAALYVHRLSLNEKVVARALQTHITLGILCRGLYKHAPRVREPPPQQKINNEICILCTWSRGRVRLTDFCCATFVFIFVFHSPVRRVAGF